MAPVSPIGFQAVPVVPADNADLPNGPAAGLWVSGAGTVTVIPVGQSSAVPLGSIAAGTLIPIAVKRVMATGTAATNIQALYQ